MAVSKKELSKGLDTWRSVAGQGLLMEILYIRKGFFNTPCALFLVNAVDTNHKINLRNHTIEDDILLSINVLWTDGRYFGSTGNGALSIGQLIDRKNEFELHVLSDMNICRDMRCLPEKVSRAMINDMVSKASMAASKQGRSLPSDDVSRCVLSLSSLYPTGFSRKPAEATAKKQASSSLKRRQRRWKAQSKKVRAECGAIPVSVGPGGSAGPAYGSMYVPAGGPRIRLVSVRGLNPRFYTGQSPFWTTQQIIDGVPSYLSRMFPFRDATIDDINPVDGTGMICIHKDNENIGHIGGFEKFDGRYIWQVQGHERANDYSHYFVYIREENNLLGMAGDASEHFEYPIF